jgi:heterodisulfide reductase subunit A2
MSRFVIFGSGISGCTAGYELAEMGHSVYVAETGNKIGGKILDYSCKATEECSRCGVCVAHAKVQQALRHPGIHFSAGAEVRAVTDNGKEISVGLRCANPSIDYSKCIDCRACVGACPEDCVSRLGKAELVEYSVDFSRCAIHNGEVCTACADACPVDAISCGSGTEDHKEIVADGVLIATGHEAFDATRKARYGYGRLPNVITGVEAEAILAKQDRLGNPADSIAFVQCVGSRDPQIGNSYCSAVCCAYALRLARIIKYRTPDTDVVVYYIDIQNFDKTFTLLREELVDSGVRFVRGVPFRVEQAPSGKLRLLREAENGDESDSEHDLVVLSVGMEPVSDAEKVAESFGIEQDEFGFFRGSENVSVCGTCKEPLSIPDAMASARSVALSMAKGKFLRKAGPN